MHCMLVVVFDDQTKADKGKAALLQLDNEGSLRIYGYAVLAKNSDGTVVVQQAGHGMLSPYPKRLLERLTGAGHAALGAALPACESGPGTTEDNLEQDFIHDTTQLLLPNRVAIVAEVEEEWTAALDRRMEAIGGVVFRWMVPAAQQAIGM